MFQHLIRQSNHQAIETDQQPTDHVALSVVEVNEIQHVFFD